MAPTAMATTEQALFKRITLERKSTTHPGKQMFQVKFLAYFFANIRNYSAASNLNARDYEMYVRSFGDDFEYEWASFISLLLNCLFIKILIRAREYDDLDWSVFLSKKIPFNGWLLSRWKFCIGPLLKWNNLMMWDFEELNW